MLFRLSLPFAAMLQVALTNALAWLTRACFRRGGFCCCFQRGPCAVSEGSVDSLSQLFSRESFSRTYLALVISSFTTVTTVVFDTITCVSGEQCCVPGSFVDWLTREACSRKRQRRVQLACQ